MTANSIAPASLGDTGYGGLLGNAKDKADQRQAYTGIAVAQQANAQAAANRAGAKLCA